MSGIVREEFKALGHDAWSCDLLPTEIPGNHYQEDIFDVVGLGWDLAIFHPPCTYLTAAANRWLYEDCKTTTAAERLVLRDGAVEFFQRLLAADIPRIAIENPKPHPYLIERVGKCSQVVQPYYFGEPYKKTTYLWLKNLPPLMYTSICQERIGAVHFEGPGKDRAKNRSRTYRGFAKAMARQWSIND